MTNANTVFKMAMSLMDELSTVNGSADTAENREYRDRTLDILNMLTGELYPYSDNFPRSCTGRPVAPPVKSFEEAICLDDYICRSLLPYGLAARLLLAEDPESALWCENKFQMLKSSLSAGYPAQWEEIEDVYSGLGHGEFSSW